jgi:hypothetical protein
MDCAKRKAAEGMVSLNKRGAVEGISFGAVDDVLLATARCDRTG